MPDDDPNVAQKDRHTGEAGRFLARARRAASERVIAANQARTDAIASANRDAQATRDAAHSRALATLGQDLENVCVVTEDAVVIRDASGGVIARLPATGAANAAIDAGAGRIYWARFGVGDAIALAPDDWNGNLLRGQIALYPEPSYTGRPWLCWGTVADFRNVSGLNDAVVSLRLGPDTAVTLFEHIGFGGQFETFNQDMPSLGVETPGIAPSTERERAGWAVMPPDRWRRGYVVSNMASSLELRSPEGVTAQGQVTVFEHAGYGGSFMSISQPGLSDFKDSRVGYGWISSVRVGPNTAVTLYSDKAYGGRAQRYVASVSNLQGSFVGNDSVQSLKIEAFNELQLVSANLDGSEEFVAARVPLFGSTSPFAGSVAVDPASGAVFWMLTSGILMRVDHPGLAPTRIGQVIETPNPLRWDLAIDTVNRKLYVTDVDAVVRFDFDGSNRTIVMLRPWAPPVTNEELLTEAPIALAVDGKNGYLYGADRQRVWRTPFDGRSPELLHESNAPCGGIAIDAATQLLYWIEGWHGSEALVRLHIGDTTPPSTVFAVSEPHGRPLAVSLSTTAGAAGDRLLNAQVDRQQAQADAARSIDLAHQDATASRQRALAGLQDAHDQAASSVAVAQQTAAGRRQDAQSQLAGARADAAQHIAEAQSAAGERSREASEQGQAIEAQGRQQADAIRGSAQQQLDDARRRRQG